MILRVFSPTGRSRLEVENSTTVQQLIEKVNPHDHYTILVNNKQNLLLDYDKSSTISTALLKNGDSLNLSKRTDVTTRDIEMAEAKDKNIYIQSELDIYLDSKSGQILRKKDPQFCLCLKNPDEKSMCDYCMPLEPYDERYMEKQGIKHLSFHAYLKKLRAGASKTTDIHLPALDSLEFKVTIPCKYGNHPPYPKGICSKCQPSAATLQTQEFRMVDHLEFESAEIVETFLSSWRSSGNQRFGYLYGRYEEYDKVPLGVKAVVCAIYEPKQENYPDRIQLTLPEDTQIDKFASLVGVERVGMIYSDLVDDGTGKGTVHCKRHGESYFLSGAEVFMAAENQLKHPTAIKYSSVGHFSSRFVTCVLTGNTDSQIDLLPFQVTNMTEAMVRDRILDATIDPSLMRVKESTSTQYVPEVFWKYKNKYGALVKEAAKPTFPVDYLLVTQTHGFPQVPQATFETRKFPIESRKQPRNASDLKRHFNGCLSGNNITNPDLFCKLLNDFHLLYFIYTSGTFDSTLFKVIVDVASSKKESSLQLLESEAIQTLVLLMQGDDSMGDSSSSSSSSNNNKNSSSSSGSSAFKSGQKWSCRHCTFVNSPGTDTCEMCGLPNE